MKASSLLISVAAAIALSGCQSEPTSFADCVFEKIEPGFSDDAIQLIRGACMHKFPDAELIERAQKLRTEEVFREAAISANAAATRAAAAEAAREASEKSPE